MDMACIVNIVCETNIATVLREVNVVCETNIDIACVVNIVCETNIGIACVVNIVCETNIDMACVVNIVCETNIDMMCVVNIVCETNIDIVLCVHSRIIPVPADSPLRGRDVRVCVFSHKPAELAHSFLFRSWRLFLSLRSFLFHFIS